MEKDRVFSMDKIEKAMKKALLGNAVSEGNNIPDSIESKAEQTAGIIYTQTRQHRINEEMLVQRRIVAHQQCSAEADVFKMLRTKILKKLRKNSWNNVAITSPMPGAGKSMVAVNLAIAMAMDVNQTVLLVDMDLKSPKVHWYFDLHVKKGLRDFILADLPLTDILVNPEFERLVVLPGRGETSESSSELLTGPKVQQMIEEIKNRYQSRIIIFDLPSILSSDDVLATLDYYDGLLLVLEEGGSQPDEIKKALQVLSGKNLLGTVLNKCANLPAKVQAYD